MNHRRYISVSDETYSALVVIAKRRGISIVAALETVCGVPVQPSGRQATAVYLSDRLFSRLKGSHWSRRRRFEQAINRALDAEGAAR